MARSRRRCRPAAPSRGQRWLLLGFRYLREFFLHTSQQGYKYIAQPGRSVVERVFWGVVVALAVVTATYIILLQWDFHLSRYTITTLEAAHYPIWNVPFPAVTVCDINKVQRSTAERLAGEMELPEGVSQSQMVEELGLLIELIESNQRNITKLEPLQAVLDLNNKSIPDLMKELVPSCDKLLSKCRWKGILRECSELFVMRKTYEGYCCSFNYLGIHDELIKHAVDLNMKNPKRISSSGKETGLSVLVLTQPEEYHATVLASYGVKVLFHDSYDYPSMNVVKKIVPVGSEMFFSLQPWITYSTKSVRSVNRYKRGWRGCLFPDERQLNLMKRYSYDNCVMECRNNVTVEKCGCSPFYFPYAGNQKICNLLDVPCIADNNKTLQTMYPGNNETNKNLEEGPVTYPCGCLPDCENLYYPQEDYEGQLATVTSNSHTMFMEALNTRNHSVFHVFFGNFMATRYRRTVLYSWKSLLGSFGGLLSLFIGFSLISGFELVYFFTIRLFYIVRSPTYSQTQDTTVLDINNILNGSNPMRQKAWGINGATNSRPQVQSQLRMVRPYPNHVHHGLSEWKFGMIWASERLAVCSLLLLLVDVPLPKS